MKRYEAMFRCIAKSHDEANFDKVTDYILSLKPLNTNEFKNIMGEYIRYHRQIRRIDEKIDLLYSDTLDGEIRETEYRKWCIEFGFITEDSAK